MHGAYEPLTAGVRNVPAKGQAELAFGSEADISQSP